jgi:hypothetical protein
MIAFSTVRFECASGYIAPKSFTFGISMNEKIITFFLVILLNFDNLFLFQIHNLLVPSVGIDDS